MEKKLEKEIEEEINEASSPYCKQVIFLNIREYAKTPEEYCRRLKNAMIVYGD